MSLYTVIGQTYNLTQAQCLALETGLEQLKHEFCQEGIDPNDEQFAAQYFQSFEQLLAQFGFDESDIEAFVNHLFQLDQYYDLVTYIACSYRTFTGDEELFGYIFEQMWQDQQCE